MSYEQPGALQAARTTPIQRARSWARGHRAFLLIVVLPTILAAAYLYLIAADQYQSEAHFVVRTADEGASAPTGLGQALTVVGGATSSERDTLIVADFLTSHEAVAELQRRIGLVDRFRRDEADPVSRLQSAAPSLERLTRYYRGKVNVDVSSETGIATLRVRSFTPRDSYAIIRQMLQLSEERINSLNRRSYDRAVEMASSQLDEAERAVNEVQGRMTAFRGSSRDFNPSVTGSARTGMVATLEGQLAQARAQLSAMQGVLASNSPQVTAMRGRVAGLERQVSAERGQLSSGPGNVARGLGTYEGLQMRQDLAGKQFEAASVALQRARESASKQQLYLVQIVDPNLPGKALYPERLKVLATVFCALLLAFGIGWLIVAGVREHAA